MHRRRLLQAAGLAPGTLFLPSLLDSRAAYAALPKRIVVFQTRHGPVNRECSVDQAWEFRGNGLDGAREAEWEIPLASAAQSIFGKQLGPLFPHRNDLMILEGLAFTSSLPAGGNGHQDLLPYRFACGGPNLTSFEQYIADAVKVPGRIPYIYYNSYGDQTFGHFKDGAPLAPAPLTPTTGNNFVAAFDRLFKDAPAAGSTPTAPAPAGPPTPSDINRKHHNESVDFLRAQYASVLGRLGSEDKRKLEQHHAMLADLKRDVSGGQTQVLKGCEKPEYPAKVAMSASAVTEVAMSLMYPLAMACDQTRVGLFTTSALPPTEYGAPATVDTHVDAAHEAGNNAQATTWMETYYSVHAAQFAKLVAGFKSVPEGNGTMLDNSLLLWVPELANGGHRRTNLLTVMAGGLSGAFKTGRYIKYGETGPSPGGKYSRNKLGPSVSHLYVSIMNAMGVNRNSIGMTSVDATIFGTGPIDLTGPLRRLQG